MPAKPKTLAEPRPQGPRVKPVPPVPRTEPPRRLVVELTRAAAADLARFVEEEDANKTTIVNRALAVYAAVRSAQEEGGKVLLRDGKTGDLMQLVLI